MGQYWSSAWQGIFKKKRDVRLLMLGLDCAGKTSILYKLKLGEVVSTVPTIGFSCESVDYKNLSFTLWDLGGQDKIRVLWRYYYENVDAVIYVVDSNDRERLELASDELQKLLSEPELAEAPFIVFANKQDLIEAASVPEVAKALGLDQLRGRVWHIQGTSVLTGAGIYEGLDWIAKSLKP